MTKTVRAIFDGEVFRPEEPVDLKPNTEYVVTIELEDESDVPYKDHDYPLTTISKLATDMGVTDLAAHHNWYAHSDFVDDE